MSTSGEVVSYTMNGNAAGFLPDGSSFSAEIGLYLNAVPGSTDITDEIAGNIQQALVAAFPPSWGVTNGELPLAKTDQTTVSYATDYGSTPISFS
jgi:hypothetical protein